MISVHLRLIKQTHCRYVSNNRSCDLNVIIFRLILLQGLGLLAMSCLSRFLPFLETTILECAVLSNKQVNNRLFLLVTVQHRDFFQEWVFLSSNIDREQDVLQEWRQYYQVSKSEGTRKLLPQDNLKTLEFLQELS